MKRMVQKNIVNYQIQCERRMLRMWLSLGVGFLYPSLIYHMEEKGLIVLAVLIVCMLFISRLVAGSRFSIRHSNVGSELMKYGELEAMIKDVNEQVRNAWYCTGDQAITERYIVLVEQGEEISGYPGDMKWEKKRFFLLSTGELARVEVEADPVYSGEMNSLVFVTMSGEIHRMTIYKSYAEVCNMKDKIEHCMERGRGPGRKSTYTNPLKKEKRQRQTAPPAKHTVLGYIKNIKRNFYAALAGIALIVVVVATVILMTEEEALTLKALWRDIRNWPELFAFLAAEYLLPFLFIRAMIYQAEKQIQKSYERLKYHEQQALDRLVSESPALKMGDVLYAERCFWFRNFRTMWLHSLVFYEDIVWLYPARGMFQMNVHGVDMPNVMFSKLVFHTKDGRRYSIFMGDWDSFSFMCPYAIKGYGKEQKRRYREYRQSRKKH